MAANIISLEGSFICCIIEGLIFTAVSCTSFVGLGIYLIVDGLIVMASNCIFQKDLL